MLHGAAPYTAAGLTSAQIATIGFNEQNAIVQTAVWATAYGATSASIGGGGTENATLDLVLNALLTAASGKTEGVGFINFPPPNIGNNGSKNQDMLYSVTPEPSSMAIAALVRWASWVTAGSGVRVADPSSRHPIETPTSAADGPILRSRVAPPL